MTQTPHASMNTLLSFWSDIENVERAPHQAIQNDILEYLKWVQDEKARADAAVKELGLMESERDQYKMWQLDEEKRANDAEAREQRLKEAVETIKELSKWDGISQYLDRCYIEASDVLATLYPDTPAPKEGDTDASLD